MLYKTQDNHNALESKWRELAGQKMAFNLQVNKIRKLFPKIREIKKRHFQIKRLNYSVLLLVAGILVAPCSILHLNFILKKAKMSNLKIL